MRRCCAIAIALTSLALAPLRALAGAPDSGAKPDPQAVARQVDAALAAELLTTSEARAQLAPKCDDATFLRRTWLDVVGDIPAPEHVAAFLLDPSPDKRQRLVRDLLADPQYGLTWARYWRDVIFYRRIEDRALIAANALEADLSAKLNANRAWDEISADFITAQGDVRDNGATALIMAQDGRTEETTAEVARILLGVQIQCAQCHDHPYDRWKREEFHELAAFFPRIGVRPVQSATQRSFAVIANDRPVVRKRGDNENRPTPEHFMPDLADPAAPGTRMQPKFFLTHTALPYGTRDVDRRETLAGWLTANEWFAKAIVNRMWAELVGEGFYEPIDDLGPDRKASAPATIDLLAREFLASGYDLKWLFETICATGAYQRESRERRDPEGGVAFAANVAQPLRADVLYNALLSALDMDEQAAGRRRGNGNGGGMGQGRNRGQRGQFAETFGYDPSDPRESIAGSIPQVLAMMNSSQVIGGARAGRGIVKRLLREFPDETSDDNEKLVAELYLQTLSREPTNAELRLARQYINKVGTAGGGERSEAVEDLTWALVNSAEFRHRR